MFQKLPFYEWCIILLFCAILLVLAGLALGRQSSEAPLPPQSEVKELHIKVEGAVAKPGTYSLPLNASLKELMEQAQLLPEADLSQLRWRRKLRDGQTIHVPKRSWITITITGAVQQPGPLKVLSGTRWQELADQLLILPEADLKALRRRRRFLKEGDRVDVPTKQSQVNCKLK